MTQRSTSTSSIFEDGKLKPGTYKIQNIETDNYLDIEAHTRHVCCRPAKDLGEGRGLWDIRRLGAGYMVEPEKPDQFCTVAGNTGDHPLVVTAYPAAWRIEVVADARYLGFEYVRFFWGDTDWVWSLWYASKANGAKVGPCNDAFGLRLSRRMWRLIPVKVEDASASSRSSSGAFDSAPLPPYEGSAPGPPSIHAQRVESEHDEFGTIVKEVTVVTTTITTSKKYRVPDA